VSQSSQPFRFDAVFVRDVMASAQWLMILRRVVALVAIYVMNISRTPTALLARWLFSIVSLYPYSSGAFVQHLDADVVAISDSR
jgi:hypothetical protein